MWTDTALAILRILIGDEGCEHSDSRLIEVLYVAAFLVVKEACLLTAYTVNIPNQTITPDPTEDMDFISLVSLRAAVLVLSGRATNAYKYGFSVTDGPSKVDTSGAMSAIIGSADKIQAMYEREKFNQCLGASIYSSVQAVITPTGYGRHGTNL